MKVTTLDVCTQGFERLRNRSEVLFVAYLNRETTRDDVAQQWCADVGALEWREGFDYDGALQLLRDAAEANGPYLEQCARESGAAPDDDSDPALCAFLFVDMEA